MDGALALNNPSVISSGMSNTKKTKKEVMNRIKNKLENAKLELIYTELEEAGIEFTRSYTTVDELARDLKGKVSEVDYNKLQSIIEKVGKSLDTLVAELDNKSTNAFTKLMTSDLAKEVAKTLGITLAGRTLLLLAPTVGTKALVGAGLAGYGLYRIIKNRKEIIKINASNELNNILMDLETTKEDGHFIETRFDEQEQKVIREFLANNKIKFEDTGYISLRQTIYNLDDNEKRSLCELLNNQFGKGIEIDKRIDSAKKKLNVVASSIATAGSGIAVGTQIATAINSIDAGAAAGVLNGTVLGSWIQSVSGKEWLAQLSGGLGLIGSEVLQHIPVVGGVASKLFAAENLAAFATIGAAGGLAVGAGLGVASVIKKIHSNKMNKKEMEEFLKLDLEKYGETDKPELQEIQNRIHEPKNLAESVIVDIVTGYLKDEGITYEGNPQTVKDLREAVNKLPKEEKKKATEVINKIYYCLDKDPDFIKGLKKAGKISISLFTTGLAALSVYDIIKGGSFLPELSQKLFPNNNMYTNITVPPVDEPFNVSNQDELAMQNQSRDIVLEFNDGQYQTLNNADYQTAYGDSFIKHNPSFKGVYNGTAVVDAGVTNNAANNIHILDFLIPANNAPQEMVPNVTAICARLDQLSPEELYAFTRYINSLSGGGPMLETLKQVLGYETYLSKVSSYITGLENTQKMHDLIANVSSKIATGAIPLAAGLTMIGIAQKDSNKDVVDNSIEDNIQSLGK